MNQKYTATVANFNCTFKVGAYTYPMLQYFENLIYPAFCDYTLVRKIIKNGEVVTRFHISDVKLIEIEDGSLALVGKHIKRTILEISPDFDAENGFIGQAGRKPSAPYSTFIILLNNHRVIYFPNMPGAPDVRSFASTANKILRNYISKKNKSMINMLKENDYIYENVKYESIKSFKYDYLNTIYPTPELNIIPIESKELAKLAFQNISSISKVEFKFYKPNNEPLNFDNTFDTLYAVTIEGMDAKNSKLQIGNPQKIGAIESAITSSNGKTDYRIDACDKNKQPLILTPNSLTEKVIIESDNDLDIEISCKGVYNQLKEKEIIRNISDHNKNLFEKMFSSLKSLI